MLVDFLIIKTKRFLLTHQCAGVDVMTVFVLLLLCEIGGEGFLSPCQPRRLEEPQHV